MKFCGRIIPEATIGRNRALTVPLVKEPRRNLAVMLPDHDNYTRPISALGDTLLVGEGDFSFAKSLAKQTVPKSRSQIIATCYEPLFLQVTEKKQPNIQALQEMGVTVRGGVDATALSQTIAERDFETIIWNFPHTGSRSISEHRRLLARFFSSCGQLIQPQGTVYVTLKHSKYYRGWRIEQQAAKHGFEVVDTTVLKFDDFYKAYPDYVPLTTKQETRIPGDYAITYLFRLKE